MSLDLPSFMVNAGTDFSLSSTSHSVSSIHLNLI